MFQRLLAVLFCVLLCGPAGAQERRITLGAPAALEETGLLAFMLPRFSLKTSIRITPEIDPAAHADLDVLITTEKAVTLGETRYSSEAVFEDTGGKRYAVVLPRVVAAVAEDARATYARRFGEWLGSEIGLRTLESFRQDGVQIYRAAAAEAVEEQAPMFEGDAVAGERLSLAHCGRCHVVNVKNRMSGLGSTPSFRALKALRDWDYRFQVFHVLAPHPAFTQIDHVTDPFDPMLPSPIAPMKLTQDDIDAILAYVSTLAPADLGAPVKAQ